MYFCLLVTNGTHATKKYEKKLEVRFRQEFHKCCEKNLDLCKKIIKKYTSMYVVVNSKKA